MCLWNTTAPGNNKVKIGYFLYKGPCQGHKNRSLTHATDDIWKDFISLVKYESLSLMAQVKAHTHTDMSEDIT